MQGLLPALYSFVDMAFWRKIDRVQLEADARPQRSASDAHPARRNDATASDRVSNGVIRSNKDAAKSSGGMFGSLNWRGRTRSDIGGKVIADVNAGTGAPLTKLRSIPKATHGSSTSKAQKRKSGLFGGLMSKSDKQSAEAGATSTRKQVRQRIASTVQAPDKLQSEARRNGPRASDTASKTIRPQRSRRFTYTVANGSDHEPLGQTGLPTLAIETRARRASLSKAPQAEPTPVQREYDDVDPFAPRSENSAPRYDPKPPAARSPDPSHTPPPPPLPAASRSHSHQSQVATCIHAVAQPKPLSSARHDAHAPANVTGVPGLLRSGDMGRVNSVIQCLAASEQLAGYLTSACWFL